VFRLGLPEILVILVVAVVLINPKQLPGIFRKVGKGVRQLGRMRAEFRRSVQEMEEGLGLSENGTPGGGGGQHGAEAGGGAAGRGGRPAPGDRERWDEGGGI
jgi:hypothetical protein